MHITGKTNGMYVYPLKHYTFFPGDLVLFLWYNNIKLGKVKDSWNYVFSKMSSKAEIGKLFPAELVIKLISSF